MFNSFIFSQLRSGEWRSFVSGKLKCLFTGVMRSLSLRISEANYVEASHVQQRAAASFNKAAGYARRQEATRPILQICRGINRCEFEGSLLVVVFTQFVFQSCLFPAELFHAEFAIMK